MQRHFFLEPVCGLLLQRAKQTWQKQMIYTEQAFMWASRPLPPFKRMNNSNQDSSKGWQREGVDLKESAKPFTGVIEEPNKTVFSISTKDTVGQIPFAFPRNRQILD